MDPLMNFLPYVGFALLVVAGIMLDAHRRTWREEDANGEATHRDRRASRAKYLRRMQASGTIGVLGILLMVQSFVPRSPLAFAIYMLVLVVLCGWLVMLGVVDAFASWLKGHRERERALDSRQKLEAEIKAARERK
jgi:hypothetical protein